MRFKRMLLPALWRGSIQISAPSRLQGSVQMVALMHWDPQSPEPKANPVDSESDSQDMDEGRP